MLLHAAASGLAYCSIEPSLTLHKHISQVSMHPSRYYFSLGHNRYVAIADAHQYGLHMDCTSSTVDELIDRLWTTNIEHSTKTSVCFIDISPHSKVKQPCIVNPLLLQQLLGYTDITHLSVP